MSGFKEIIKHGRNYLVANLATSALAFISIPVYTRLLSATEYGVWSIFLGVAVLLGSVVSLGMDRSVSRYYFDRESMDDFSRFVGTSSILATVAFILNSLILVIFADYFGKLVGLKNSLVYLLVPFTLMQIVGLTFKQIFGPQKKSKIIAVSSLYQVYIGFALSILFILIFKSNKYYALIWGHIIAGFILSVYWLRQMRPYFKLCFDKSFVRYIFIYSVPLIPYALSGVIIAQFGKIAIGRTQSVSDAGFYSLANAIGSLVYIIISVSLLAWNPYYFEYMNKKKYDQLDKDFLRIFKITVVFAFCIASFGKEIGLLLAKRDFTKSLYLIPIFTIGYVFYQLAYAYLRNFQYSKNTFYMTITILLSGISNVVLNFILIPKLNELGAAIAFLLSYVIMALLAWAINKYLVKLHATPLKFMLVPLLIAAPFYCLLYLMAFVDSIVISLFLKTLLTSTFVVLVFFKDRENILGFIKGLTKSRREMN